MGGPPNKQCCSSWNHLHKQSSCKTNFDGLETSFMVIGIHHALNHKVLMMRQSGSREGKKKKQILYSRFHWQVGYPVPCAQRFLRLELASSLRPKLVTLRYHPRIKKQLTMEFKPHCSICIGALNKSTTQYPFRKTLWSILLLNFRNES